MKPLAARSIFASVTSFASFACMTSLAHLAGSLGAICLSPTMLIAQPTRAQEQPAVVAPVPRAGPDNAWWNDAVFYEIFVRSFKDSSSGPNANDGIGDFDGITEKLDYLNNGKNDGSSLGVTGLWLMPIFPSPSYHGYDVTDYQGVHPDYGSMESFKRLLAECHKRNIRVILDLTLNHCSSEHEWFKQASKPDGQTRDWFVWADAAPAKQGGAYGGSPWHKLGGKYYYGIFSKGMPDFNCSNPDVTDALHELSRFWLQDVGVDGFRLDAIRHLIEVDGKQENTPETHEWIKGYRKFIKGAKPEAMTVGEVWDSSANAAKYVGDELDMVFEFALAQATLDSINAGNADTLRKAYAEVAGAYPLNQYGSFLTNHDQTRVMNVLKHDPAKARVAATLLLTGPGVPFIYYGEEIGMTGDKPDELLRTPMQWSDGANAGFSGVKPWQRENKDAGALNVANQLADPGSLLRHYQSLVALRAQHPALSRGSLYPVAVNHPGLYAFLRTQPGAEGALDAVLVVANLSNQEVSEGSLTLGASPLRGEFNLHALLGRAGEEKLVANPQGGFGGVKLVGALGPYSASVIHLRPK